MRKVLVTGAAGFIGARTAEVLLEKGWKVLGVDNLNDYYDVRLKKHRLTGLKKFSRFKFIKVDIEDLPTLKSIFRKFRPQAVINLAARAGVRYSLENPFVYMSTNAVGTLNILEACKELSIRKIVTASTSALYAGQKMPFKETSAANDPISPYAASKKSAELLCNTYHRLYGLDITVLRYFTVYGPAGRPDMSPFRFIRWIAEGRPVQVFGSGKQSRDFTYVDDIAAGTVKALRLKGFQVVNLGGNKPCKLSHFIALIEKKLGKKARINYLPTHKTDVNATWADISKARRLLGWKPSIGLGQGLSRTIEWYRQNRSWASKIKL